jgi:transposase
VGSLILGAQEQFILEVVCKVETGKLTRPFAQKLLQVSARTLRRYLKGYRKKGIGFIRHGNRGRAPKNKLNPDLKSKVQWLVKEKYFDFNMLHAMEKLKEELGVSLTRETMRRWCHEIGMVKRSKRRRSKPRFKRPRMAQAGLLIQMDGSHHRWFGDRETCLIAAIDDATSEVVGAEFFEGETTFGCLKVLREVVSKKGVFKVLYVDRAGLYGGIKRQGFSQVARALEELGTQIIYANSPEAKGRIERLFQTLQDRLIPEMRLSNIRTIEQANEFLQQIYLPNQHNPRYMLLPHVPQSAWQTLPSGITLEDVFCIKEYRLVGRDHTISWGAERMMIADPIKYSIHRQRIEMRSHRPGQWKAYFAGKPIRLVKVERLKKMVA